MVRQVAADMLDTDIAYTVISQNPLGGFRTGDASAGKLIGLAFESIIHIGTCPKRQNHAGQDNDQISPVESIIIGHKDTSREKLNRLQGIVQYICDGTAEDRIGLAVQCLQSARRIVDRDFSGHKQILVKNEFDFLILLLGALDHAGPGMDLHPASATDSQFRVNTAAAGILFRNILLRQRT